MNIRVAALCENEFFITSLNASFRKNKIIVIDWVTRHDDKRLKEVAGYKCDIILLEESRYQLITYFKKLPEQPKVILYCSKVTQSILDILNSYPFDGFFYEESGTDAIIKCIKEVHENRKYICP